jgi:hypothetical protein
MTTATFALYMFISSGFGSSAVGGPLIIDGFTSSHNCEADRADWAERLGSQLDTSFCKEIIK